MLMFEVFFCNEGIAKSKAITGKYLDFFLYLSNGDKTLFPLQYIWLNQDKNKCNNNWNRMHSVIEIV